MLLNINSSINCNNDKIDDMFSVQKLSKIHDLCLILLLIKEKSTLNKALIFLTC